MLRRSTLLARRVAPSCVRSLSSNPSSLFFEQGVVDEQGLVAFDTLHEMQVNSCKVFENKSLFGTFSKETKQYEWMTYADYATKVNQCRAVLHDLDVKAGGKVGIISNNRWEWATIAAAAYSLNATIVPMYEAQLPADWTYILNDSEAKVLFVANDPILATVRREVLENAPNVHTALSLDAAEGQSHAFATAMANHQPDSTGQLIRAPTPEDLADLIYTSGTTGKPKGVELTHANFSSNVHAAALMAGDPRTLIRDDERTLAFLPWAHSYGQTCELWLMMANGGAIGVSRGIPSILEDLQLVQPTALYSVPTLYKRIYDGVHNMMETALPIRKAFMKRALALGREKADIEQGKRGPFGYFEKMQHNFLDSLILSKVRARFGGRMRLGFVAGAACPKQVIDFMDSIGIPIYEGYGLTETSPIISLNVPGQRSVGTVGRPVGGVSVYIVDDNGNEVAEGEGGEICCVGPNVMRGYYKNPEATAEVISTAPDGVSRMFHTGDLGRRTADGYIKVTGRLKEQYKLENGKYVVPTPIEEAIGMSRFITQVVLCGANRDYNVALLVPAWDAIRTELKVDESISEDELASDKRVKNLIDNEIMTTCARLKKFEIPKQWSFVAPFTAANNMLTPKMSIRRHRVIHEYAEVISHMYGDEKVVAEAADSDGAKEHEEAPKAA